MSGTRPEYVSAPEDFYDDKEAAKYTRNPRMMKIQEQLTERALELLALPPGKSAFLLDVGCGSGLSGRVLSSAGHVWVGCDISQSMLQVAVDEGNSIEELEGTVDVLTKDMGQGLAFRSGMFDGAVSISALQWLCYS